MQINVNQLQTLVKNITTNVHGGLKIWGKDYGEGIYITGGRANILKKLRFIPSINKYQGRRLN